MQLKPITVIAVLLLVIASLLIAGCTVNLPNSSSPTPSPTTTPTVTTPTQSSSTDYSSELTKLFESGNFNMIQPFGKSINERGNDVYKGVGINATGHSVTIVVEFIRSDADAKSVYNAQVASKEKEGYVFSAERTASRKAECKDCGGEWVGTNGNEVFLCDWEDLWQFDTYAVVTQSWVNT